MSELPPTPPPEPMPMIGPVPPPPPPPPGSERQSLHPLTPVLDSFRFLVAAAVASGIQIVNSGNYRFAVFILGAAAVIGGISSLISMQYTGYQLYGADLHIFEGVFTRKHRTIPLQRLQGVDIVQPLRARLFGLAQLRIEVAGANQTEPPLSYLKLDKARELRRQLLAVSRGVQPHEEAPETQEKAPAARPLAAVPLDRLAAATVLEALPGLVIGAVFIAAATAVTSALWGFTTVTTTLWAAVIAPSLFGYAISTARNVNRFLRNGRFTLHRREAAFRIESGITDRRSETVPLGRITALSVEQPLLWRSKGWRRVVVSTAAFAGEQAGGATTVTVLLPVGTVADADPVIAVAMPGPAWDRVATVSPPRRAAWRVPFQWRRYGAALTEEGFVVRRGLFTRTVTVVPYARIQSVRVVQGPLQRFQGLATVRAMTAGGHSHDAAAKHRNAAEAVAIAADLRERADAASAHEEPRLSLGQPRCR